MTFKQELKAALKALNVFEHVSSSSLIPVQKFPAVVLDSAQPRVEIAEDSLWALLALKLTVSVLVGLTESEINEKRIDAAEEQIESLVDQVRTAFAAMHRGVTFSNEMVDPVKIDGRNCLLWQFDAEFKT